MSMDFAGLLAIISFAIQIAAGVAPMRWPECKWLAGFIFWAACAVAVGSALWWLADNWSGLMARITPNWLIVFGLICALIGVAWQMSGRTEPRRGTAAPVADSVNLRLFMRPNDLPQEVSKTNIYRWYTLRNEAINTTDGSRHHIGTQFFLVFESPLAATSYYRISSPTHPNLQFRKMDLCDRSMVIVVEADPAGATVDFQVSDKPI